MRKQLLKNLSIIVCSGMLASCGFFDKDNIPSPAPLMAFKPIVNPHYLWSTNTGNGSAYEYLRMNPVMGSNAIFTTSSNGTITAVNKQTGRILWQKYTRVLTGAGPGAGDGIVALAGRKGGVLAVHQQDGSIAWQASAPGEILAAPSVGNGTVVVKTTDGTVYAFSSQTGRRLWDYQQTEPNLVLHGSSEVLISDNAAFVGFANGNLAKLTLRTGDEAWRQPIAEAQGAFAIQRMIDIDANPMVYGHHVFAATYQGNIAALDWNDGSTIWSRNISSYTGMTTDGDHIYISDARSHLWSFNARNGSVDWRQTKLDARVISAPALIGQYIVVGDAEGYVHWLNKTDGSFAARVKAGAPIYAVPLVENNVAYVFTSKGSLQAYLLS